MKRTFLAVVLAMLFTGCATSPGQHQPKTVNVTKREVIAQLGFPAEVQLFEAGGPFIPGATEVWLYYVRRASGEIVTYQIWFRNGRSYSGAYVRDGEHIIDIDQPSAIETILAYKKEKGLGVLSAH